MSCHSSECKMMTVGLNEDEYIMKCSESEQIDILTNEIKSKIYESLSESYLMFSRSLKNSQDYINSDEFKTHEYFQCFSNHVLSQTITNGNNFIESMELVINNLESISIQLGIAFEYCGNFTNHNERSIMLIILRIFKVCSDILREDKHIDDIIFVVNCYKFIPKDWPSTYLIIRNHIIEFLNCIKDGIPVQVAGLKYLFDVDEFDEIKRFVDNELKLSNVHKIKEFINHHHLQNNNNVCKALIYLDNLSYSCSTPKRVTLKYKEPSSPISVLSSASRSSRSSGSLSSSSEEDKKTCLMKIMYVLMKDLKKDNPDRISFYNMIELLLDRRECNLDIATILIKQHTYIQNIICLDTKNIKEYDEKIRLWKSQEFNFIVHRVRFIILELLKTFEYEIMNKLEFCQNISNDERNLDILQKIINLTKGVKNKRTSDHFGKDITSIILTNLMESTSEIYKRCDTFHSDRLPLTDGKNIILTTGEFEERTKDQYFSTCSPLTSDVADPNKIDEINQWLNIYMCNDIEMIVFLKKMFGLFISGVSEQYFFIFMDQEPLMANLPYCHY